MTKNRATLILSVLTLLFFITCDKDEIRLPNFFVEFATLIKNNSFKAIQLDNGKILIPEDASNIKIEDGSRIIVNYSPLENDSIRINGIQEIFLGEIITEGYSDEMKSDPVKLITRWVSGNYLNMSFEIDYHSKPHSARLYKDMLADKPILYFIYSREEDPPGAPSHRDISFNLDGLEKEDFTVYINTYKEGLIKIDFNNLK